MPATRTRASATPECTHCGQPVPGATPTEEVFCCQGCRVVWDILHSHGLGGYYRHAEREGQPANGSGRPYDEFDHDTFTQLYVRKAGLHSTTDLYLEGVHCSACIWLVERLPRLLPGVIRAELDLPRGRAQIWWDSTTVALSAIARMLDTLGYRPHPFRGADADAVRRREDRSQIARMGIAGALAANVMLIAVAMYGGWFSGMDQATERFFRWISLGLTTAAVGGPGLVFLRGGYASLRTRSLHMDLPIAIALTAGYGRGFWNTVMDTGPVYFDGVSVLVFLLLVGRYLQHRAQRAALDRAELLYSVAPSTARLLDSITGSVQVVPTEALLPGMVVQVWAGERIPVDGRVTAGTSDLNNAMLSGESAPVAVGPADVVWAGAINLSSTLAIVASASGEESRLGKVLGMVAEGARRRTPLVQLAQRTAGWFVGVVLLLAVITLGVWWPHDPSLAIDHAIALLIVTCPCALALATPLAVSSAIGQAARAGMLIKDGAVLETLGLQPGTMFVDKTGTLTEGNTTLVVDRIPVEVRSKVLAVERDALHPVARGFRRAWASTPSPTATSVRQVIGHGVEGTVDGVSVVVGSPSFVASQLGAAHLPPPSLPVHLTPIVVGVGGQVVGSAGFGDRIRPGTRGHLDTLRQAGWRLCLLTGDAAAVANRIGTTLGFRAQEIFAEQTPEDKVARVADTYPRPVVMVGDGVNDAAAMAAATAGIAVHGSAETSLLTADVHLSEADPGLAGVYDLYRGATSTIRIVRTNILFSLAYNIAGTTLAVMGLLSPFLAAILMPASSLTVIVYSWRARSFRTDR